MARQRRVRLTISLPAEDAKALDDRFAREGSVARNREEFAALLIQRQLGGFPNGPVLGQGTGIPIGPGLMALARYAHDETIRRGKCPADYSLESFLQDAMHDRAVLILDNWIGEFDPKEVRLLERLEESHSYDDDTDRARLRLVK